MARIVGHLLQSFLKRGLWSKCSLLNGSLSCCCSLTLTKIYDSALYYDICHKSHPHFYYGYLHKTWELTLSSIPRLRVPLLTPAILKIAPWGLIESDVFWALHGSIACWFSTCTACRASVQVLAVSLSSTLILALDSSTHIGE